MKLNALDDKEIMFTDGNGKFRKMTPELKRKFDDTFRFLDEYGYRSISKNEEYKEENKRKSAVYSFKNTFTIQLFLMGLLVVVCIGIIYEGHETVAYLFLGCILLMLLSLYFSFKSYIKT